MTGFYTRTKKGNTAHINGKENMSDETLEALHVMIDAVYQQHTNKSDDPIWCRVCECWQERSGLKRWTGDDRLHFLCPGCDDDLLPVERLD